MSKPPKGPGRPSKLDDRQWAEIGRRYAAGESARKLAEEYPISEASIRLRFSAQREKIQIVANKLASAELEVSAMPIAAQMSVRSLADQLKAIGGNLASAARFGSATAAELAELAHGKVKDVKDKDGKVDPVVLSDISALTQVANRAATPAFRLVAASQGREVPPDPQDEPNMSALSDHELDQFIALQEKAGGI